MPINYNLSMLKAAIDSNAQLRTIKEILIQIHTKDMDMSEKGKFLSHVESIHSKNLQDCLSLQELERE